MGFSFIHAADIHLDSPLRNLEQYADAPKKAIRGATRRAFASMVDLALEQRVDFVVLAGDLFDGDWPDFNTGLYFASQTAKLKQAGIRVFVVYGNHDAQSRITKNLRFPDNVRVFPVSRPATFHVPGLEVAVHGMSYDQRSVTSDPVPAYPAPEPGSFNLGLLHTSVTGRPGHGTYAPCTLESLVNKGYDYWALGHVHKSEILCESPLICFPGNPQGRFVTETGPKGCFLVKVSELRKIEYEFKTLDHVRWHRISLEQKDTSGQNADGIVEAVEDRLGRVLAQSSGRLCCVRVDISGHGPGVWALAGDMEKWTAEVRGRAFSKGAGQIWVEKVNILPAASEDESRELKVEWAAVQEMKAVLNEMEKDLENSKDLSVYFADLKRRLPADLLKTEDGLDMTHPNAMSALLNRVGGLLMGRMQPKEEG